MDAPIEQSGLKGCGRHNGGDVALASHSGRDKRPNRRERARAPRRRRRVDLRQRLGSHECEKTVDPRLVHLRARQPRQRNRRGHRAGENAPPAAVFNRHFPDDQDAHAEARPGCRVADDRRERSACPGSTPAAPPERRVSVRSAARRRASATPSAWYDDTGSTPRARGSACRAVARSIVLASGGRELVARDSMCSSHGRSSSSPTTNLAAL